jgi:hypothetical protein
MLRIPHCLDIRLTDGGEVVSHTCWPHFTSRKIFWYSFLLEAEHTPGPSAVGRIRSIEKKNQYEKWRAQLVNSQYRGVAGNML